MRPLIALSVMLLPASAALAAALTAPPAYSSGPDGNIGVSTVPGGPATCGPPGGSVRVWVPVPCPVRPAPARRSPAPRSPAPPPTRPARPPQPKTPVPATASVPAAAVPAALTPAAPAQGASVRPRVKPPKPRSHLAGFWPAPALPAAPAYTPGRPVLPVGVLMTVVLTPCVITVAARLGKMLAGR